MPPSPLIIAKGAEAGLEAAKTLHANHQAKNAIETNAYAAMTPEAIQEVEAGKSRRTTIKAVAGVTFGAMALGAAIYGPKLLFDDAVDRFTKFFSNVAPKQVGIVDVNNLINTLEFPLDYDLIKGTGTAGANAESGAMQGTPWGSFEYPGTHKQTAVNPEILYGITLPTKDVKITAENILLMTDAVDPKTGNHFNKPVSEMHLVATATVQDSTVETHDSTFNYDVTISKLHNDKTEDAFGVDLKQSITGSDAARRIEDLNNYAVGNWANSCSTTFQEVLDPAIAESVHNTVATAIEITKGVDPKSKTTLLLQQLLDQKIVVRYVDAANKSVSPGSFSLPQYPVMSKHDLANGLGVSEDELSLTSKKCGLSAEATPELIAIEKADRSLLIEKAVLNKGQQD